MRSGLTSSEIQLPSSVSSRMVRDGSSGRSFFGVLDGTESAPRGLLGHEGERDGSAEDERNQDGPAEEGEAPAVHDGVTPKGMAERKVPVSVPEARGPRSLPGGQPARFTLPSKVL